MYIEAAESKGDGGERTIESQGPGQGAAKGGAMR
jgi:hypothetical protein